MASEDDNPLAGLDVQLESTAEQVAGALREAIIDGGLPQGTYLRENSLSKRFNVSRNTIREATQILVGERGARRRAGSRRSSQCRPDAAACTVAWSGRRRREWPAIRRGRRGGDGFGRRQPG